MNLLGFNFKLLVLNMPSFTKLKNLPVPNGCFTTTEMTTEYCRDTRASFKFASLGLTRNLARAAWSSLKKSTLLRNRINSVNVVYISSLWKYVYWSHLSFFNKLNSSSSLRLLPLRHFLQPSNIFCLFSAVYAIYSIGLTNIVPRSKTASLLLQMTSS